MKFSGFVIAMYLGSLMTSYAFAAEGIVALSKEDIAKRKQAKAEQQAPAYIDQVIDGNMVEDAAPSELVEDISETEEAHGLTMVDASMDWQYSRSDPAQHQQKSFNFGLYQQTQDYGDWRTSGRAKQEDAGQGGYLDLQQHNYILDEDWVLNSHLGFHQYGAGNLLGTTGKLSLPFSSFSGASARINNKKTELAIQHGKKAHKDSFENIQTSSDHVTGMSIKHHASKEVDVGAEVWLNQNEQGESQHAMTTALQYDSADDSTQLKAQALMSDSGSALAFDSSTQIGRAKHRVGAYHIQAGTHWMGKEISTEKGVYWQRRKDHPKYGSSTELSWSDQGKVENWQASYAIDRQYKRSTRLSMGGSYYKQNGQAKQQDKVRLSLGVNQQWQNNSSSNLQLAVTQEHTKQANTEESAWTQSLDYSQQWALAQNQTVSAQININKAKQNNTDIQVGAAWSKQQKDTQLSASLSADLSPKREKDTLNYRVSVDHEINERWHLSGSVQRNYSDEDTDDSVRVSLSYSDSWGKAISQRDRRAGMLQLIVFFDKNKDGVKQPLES